METLGTCRFIVITHHPMSVEELIAMGASTAEYKPLSTPGILQGRHFYVTFDNLDACRSFYKKGLIRGKVVTIDE
jgi:hypothetical protein